MKTESRTRQPQKLLLCLLAALAPALAANAAPPRIEPAAAELAKAVTAKIGAAQTIRLHASHVIQPAPGLGAKVETGRIEISVQRPNKFYALQPSGDQTIEIAFDGSTLCVMHPQMKNHAIERLKAASIEQFADAVDQRFGFRPPVTELLAKDVSSQLFVNATSARVTGKGWVGLTQCDRLRIEQPGMTADLWIGIKDKLPRRMLLTFQSKQGQSTWDIRLSRWELDAPVDASLFSKRPAADSMKIKMLKSS
jgi:hypothetical protein